jgi:hypothetical protein
VKPVASERNHDDASAGDLIDPYLRAHGLAATAAASDL